MSEKTEEKRTCPLWNANSADDIIGDVTDCTQAKCGWWDRTNAQCAIESIPYMLYELLLEIRRVK